MNENVKAGEVLNLKELISYEKDSIVNLDIVSNEKMKFFLMAFDEGTGWSPTGRPVLRLSQPWRAALLWNMKERSTGFPPERASISRKMAFTA